MELMNTNLEYCCSASWLFFASSKEAVQLQGACSDGLTCIFPQFHLRGLKHWYSHSSSSNVS